MPQEPPHPEQSCLPCNSHTNQTSITTIGYHVYFSEVGLSGFILQIARASWGAHALAAMWQLAAIQWLAGCFRTAPAQGQLSPPPFVIATPKYGINTVPTPTVA